MAVHLQFTFWRTPFKSIHLKKFYNSLKILILKSFAKSGKKVKMKAHIQLIIMTILNSAIRHQLIWKFTIFTSKKEAIQLFWVSFKKSHKSLGGLHSLWIVIFRKTIWTLSVIIRSNICSFTIRVFNNLVCTCQTSSS